MTVQSRVLPLIAITGSSLVVGCNGRGGSCGSYGSYGSYGSAGSCAPGQILSPAGVYEGSLSDAASQSTMPVVAIVAENGEGRMTSQDGNYYRLSIGTVANNLTGTFAGYSVAGTLPNGGHSSSGSVSGLVVPHSLSAVLADSTNAQQSLTLNWDSVYSLGSSLGTLAGNWSFNDAGFTLTVAIQPDGALSAVDSNGCTYAGSFALIDVNFNAYSETHVRTCNGVSDVFTGLATFIPATATGSSGASTIIRLLTDDNAGAYLAADLR